VATNRYGQLPSNIIRPRWRDLKGVPTSFKDGVVGWYEVMNKPAGFADNMDDAGVTGVRLTRVAINDVPVPAGTTKLVEVFCPGGSRVTGGGFWTSSTNQFYPARNQPRSDLLGWAVEGYNNGSTPVNMSAFAVCMTAPGGTITVATKG
jgi:hypothetical protein